MTGTRDITQLCFSSNLAGIVANKIEQSFYRLFLFRNRVSRTRQRPKLWQISDVELSVVVLSINIKLGTVVYLYIKVFYLKMVFDCASDKADIYANETTCKQNIE